MSPSLSYQLCSCLIALIPHVAALQAQSAAQRVDLHDDPLPAGAVARLGTTAHRLRSVESMELSRDGKWLAVGGSRTLLIDLDTGKQKLVVDRGTHVAFSHDSRKLAVAVGAKIEIWDTTTLTKERELPAHGSSVSCLTFAPDGQSLALCCVMPRPKVLVLDAKTGETRRVFDGPTHQSQNIRFLPGGKEILTANLGYTRIWRISDGKLSRMIEEEFLDLSADGKRLVTTPDRKIGVVHIHTLGVSITAPKKVQLPINAIYSLAISHQHDFLAVNEAGISEFELALFEIPSGKKRQRIVRSPHARTPIRIDGEDRRIVFVVNAGPIDVLHVWDRKSGQRIHEIPAHEGNVADVRFLPDGKTVATLGDDQTVRLWDAATGRQQQCVTAAERGAKSLAVSPDGRRLAWIAPGSFHVWDIAEGKAPAHVRFAIFDPVRADFSPDSRWLTINTEGGAIQRYDPAAREFRGTLALVQGASSFSYSADGKWLAAAAGSRLMLHDARTGKEIHEITDSNIEEAPQLGTCMFSPEGRWLASIGPNDCVRIWDVEKKSGRDLFKHVQARGSNQLHVSALAYSHDGALVVTGHNNGTVHLWEAISFGKVAEWRAHEHAISSAHFSPDGRRLATASHDTTALIWDIAALTNAPTQGDWKSLWTDLGAPEAQKGQRAAFACMEIGPTAVPFLDERLTEMFGQDAKGAERIQDLLAELDAPSFERREKAQRELTEMGLRVLPQIRKQVPEQSSLEVRRRMERLTRSIEDKSEKQRWHLRRVVQILESINTAPARTLLQRLVTDGHEKETAQAALLRMSKR